MTVEMKREKRRALRIALCLLAAFALWTAAVCCIDVAAIGPQGTAVGFAGLNGSIHRLTGVNMKLYRITDWLGLIPLLTAAGFALLGLKQWLTRRRIRYVDRSILALGGFYIAVIAVYALFEAVIVNYRPVLINGVAEASYPSSTTMLALCVMPAGAIELCSRSGSKTFRRCAAMLTAAFCAFMVTGRLLSGVHWFTDIVGGALLSAGLVLLFRVFRS